MKNNNLNHNRQLFLQGAGISLCLPWLETFASPSSIKNNTTPRRFFSVYHPNGVGVPLKNDPAYEDWSWFPRGEERDFKLSKVLDVLEPLRQDITIYSGLSHPAARKIHGHANSDQYLTGADTKSEGENYQNTISIDQVYADHIGSQTRHRCLVMSTNGGTGAPRATHTSSFRRDGRPIPSLNKPKQIFSLLFKSSSLHAAKKLQRTNSALDFILSHSKSMKRQLSHNDQRVLDHYLYAVRETELKVEKAQKWLDTPIPKIKEDQYNLDFDIKSGSKEFLRSIYDLTYLAFLTDSTRVVTYNMGRENAGAPQDLFSIDLGLSKAGHGLTHAVKEPGGFKALGLYNRFQNEEFGHFLQKLKDTPEPTGNGSILDNTFCLHGSASSSAHLSRNYPIISAGANNLGFNNGRYLKFEKGNDKNEILGAYTGDNGHKKEISIQEEDLSHLYVTILQRLGVETNTFSRVQGGLDRV